MKLSIFDDYADLSYQVARIIYEQVRSKPGSVICLASGDTPLLAYNLFTVLLKHTPVVSPHFTLVGLDEWIGISPENKGSCSYFLHRNIIDPLLLPPEQVRLFNAMTPDPEQECRLMDEFIQSKGGIDLMIVGIGMNGHIGFNEPGVSPGLRSHVIALDETTRTVGQKYFTGAATLTKGITLGLKYLLEAKTAVLFASGEGKAPIVKAALEGEINTGVPASLMRKHPGGRVMLDRRAASLLTPGT